MGIEPFESAVTIAWRRGRSEGFWGGLVIGFIAGIAVATLLAAAFG